LSAGFVTLRSAVARTQGELGERASQLQASLRKLAA
jgi:hypothetical protein